jgi:hypothetical protein
MDGFLYQFDESDNLFPFDEGTIGGGGGIDPDEYVFTDWQRVKWKPEQVKQVKKIVAQAKKAKGPDYAKTLERLRAEYERLKAAAEEARLIADQMRRERNMRAITAFLQMVT